MKLCPSCNATYPDDAAVCGLCGARLLVDTSETVSDPKLFLIGTVIGGNYKVEELLGQGGMGAVYRARQLSLDRDVAVKLLLSPLAMDRSVLERFQREARAASNVGHPGIIQVFDMGYLKEGAPYMVMELLDGEDLRQVIRRDGAMPVAAALPIVVQVCDALQAAHDKGILHRDLKPDNIFLVRRRDKAPIVKILDFGLSKIRSADKQLTDTGTLIGTPNYMAPEQVLGRRQVDHRADIYAVGVIFFEMVTGQMAYDGPSVQSILVKIINEDPPPPRMLNPSIPSEVEAVIRRAMARDPDERYPGAGAMYEDLLRLARGMGIPRSDMSIVPTASVAAAAAPSPYPVVGPSPSLSPHGTPMTPPPGSGPVAAGTYASPYGVQLPTPGPQSYQGLKGRTPTGSRRKGMGAGGILLILLGIVALLGAVLVGLAVIFYLFFSVPPPPKEQIHQIQQGQWGEKVEDKDAKDPSAQ
jgi:serine/threonine protein kinase